MKPKKKRRFLCIPVILCVVLLFSSCGKDISTSNDTKKTNRDNEPVVLTGSADGTVTYGNESVTIDASHTQNGYLMISYTGQNPKVKLQITGADDITYTYNLHGDGYETFPLTAGSGTYQIGIFENIEGTSYATLFTQSVDAQLENEFDPYLYANQYVNFNANSKAVAEAKKISSSAGDDLEVIQNVYNYMISNFTYDYDKAATVQSGYIPDVDEVFEQKTGICFDYAAVMATMLRCERIPTRLEVGYAGDIYHAWISTYIHDKGWVNGIIEFDGKDWKLMDPTFASTSSDPKDFVTEADEYVTKYVY